MPSTTPNTLVRPWKSTLRVKSQLQRDFTNPTVVRENARVIAAALKMRREYEEGGYDEFSEMVAEFEDIATTDDDAYDETLTRAQHLSGLMRAFYDWADEERVWVA